MMSNKKKYLSLVALIWVFIGGCATKEAPPVPRTYGQEGDFTLKTNFHALTATVSACERVEQLKHEADGADLFSYAQSFSFDLDTSGPKNFLATAKLSESPLFEYILSSPRVKFAMESDPDAFMDIAKVQLKIAECNLANTANWGPGCQSTWQNTVGGALGCKIDEAASSSPACQAAWAAVIAKRRIGKCSYIETGPPAEGDLECKASAQKWALLRILHGQNKIYIAKNKFLTGSFPGIFTGKAEPAEESLLLGLLAKVRGFYLAGPEAVSQVLTAKLPLFPADHAWSSWNLDVQMTLPAIFQAVGSTNALDRVCAFELTQRMFAQLLSINGFVRPELQNDLAIPLGTDRNTLGVVPVWGTFLEVASDSSLKPTILNGNDLATYNPQNRLVLAGATTPTSAGGPGNMLESLSDRLERLESLELIYEATSPLAAWKIADQPYLLGDIDDPQSPAILPPEVHGLAFGLLGVNFKNLSFLNLRKVKADGSIVMSAQDVAAGIVLMKSIDPNTFTGEINLADLLKFTKIIVRWDNALMKLMNSDLAKIRAQNPFYSEAMIAQIRGIIDNLHILKLPLLFLISDLGESKSKNAKNSQCFERAIANIAPNADPAERRQYQNACSPILELDYYRVRKMLESSILQSQN